MTRLAAHGNGNGNGNANGDGRDLTDLMLEFRGDRMILPEGMTHDEAIQVIEKRKIEDETEVHVSETVRCFPLDGAVAFAKVLKRRFGWTNLVPQNMGFFGVRQPTLVGVEIAYNEHVQIPWGSCTVPKIEGTLSTSYTIVDDLPVFTIGGTVKRKHEHIVAEIAKEVRETVRKDSIYRGKAVKINLRDGDGDRLDDFGPDFAPRFLDLASIKTDEIVYSTETCKMLQVNVFNPVQYTEKCRRNNIPLKRGILLEGQFGTGKTLTADLLAKLCTANGWTFIYLEDARDLDVALGFAELYAPCVVFAEDIDKATKGDRTSNMDKLFNKMDGLEGKSREVMVVLTTNTIGHIHPGFLRPGRIDTIVEVTPPDAKAIAQLVKLYGRDEHGNCLINASETEVGEALRKVQGVNAAFIREVVERAKLAALANDDEKLSVTASDLKMAADTLEPHIRMLYPNIAQSDFSLEDGGEEVDPFKFGLDLMLEKAVEMFLNRLVNPKTITKLVMKKAGRKKGFGGGPSLN